MTLHLAEPELGHSREPELEADPDRPEHWHVNVVERTVPVGWVGRVVHTSTGRLTRGVVQTAVRSDSHTRRLQCHVSVS